MHAPMGSELHESYRPPVDAPQAALLIGEIAQRVYELIDMEGGMRARRLLNRLCILSDRKSALLLFARVMADDEDAMRSYSEQGAKRKVTKQAVHDRLQHDMAFIRRMEPMLADEIMARVSGKYHAKKQQISIDREAA